MMKLKAVRIAPSDNLVIIGGENEQGKSAVLKCIEMAIAGAKAIPAVPVRRGEIEGHILLDLGDLRIERTFDASGTRLIVRNADGVKQSSPQAILDKLYSKVAFDPLAFLTEKPAEQLAKLKRIVGLDFTEMDTERALLYEERTQAGRKATDAEARINTYPPACMNAPDVEISIATLLAEKDLADEANKVIENAAARYQRATAEVELLRAKLLTAEAEEAAAKEAMDAAGAKEDTTAIVEAIAGAEETNRQVRAKQARAKAVAEFADAGTERARLTKAIEAVDAEKTAAMKAAKWPVPGLGFGTNGVTLDGLPFDQASKARRMRTSLAIGMEQNPLLRTMLLPDGSLLDKQAMEILREFASDNNMQIWLERVGDGDVGALIIEDGEIVKGAA
jgi:hypothetical protein